ncbi:lycopene cyclase domain-containing protein [Cellulomonas cellasea]|uniref:lycopene cyclase domain-containing protein n=1 Tax=Cellulomonas cellasea TaxID=43670 RepID=UPI0025A4549B|nr:lycopene cyclase domain-containing protein [Cellulomonas cellasea]MDM8084469.1 lycopene cyclase domain-containing protein [Cellulomonas cellasea]
MTNAVLNVAVLAALCLVCAPVLRRLRGWAVVWTVAHLLMLTVIFDTLMIDVGLYAYEPSKILGVWVWGAPIEDFAYPVAAGIAMPVLWTVLGRRRRDRASDARAPGHSSDSSASDNSAADRLAADRPVDGTDV